jgi:UDP-glucose 4-epimerase
MTPTTHARAVVLGGSGFLGSAVAAELVESGVDTLVLDLAPPRDGRLEAAEFRQADILDAEAVANAVLGASAVFAFAARAGATTSLKDPVADLEFSCRAMLVLLEAVRSEAPDAAVVFPGSRLEYGKPRYMPVDEAHPLAGETPYAVHKSTCAAYCRLYAGLYGLRTCVLRLPNPYGPHAMTDSYAGFGILNRFVDVAVRGEAIELFGGGSQLRDFVYVGDVARAAILAAEKAPAGTVLNIGSGQGVSLAEAARFAVEVAGSGEVRCVPWPEEYEKVETGDCYLDVTEAERVLGWRPTTTLAEGLRVTVESLRARG